MGGIRRRNTFLASLFGASRTRRQRFRRDQARRRLFAEQLETRHLLATDVGLQVFVDGDPWALPENNNAPADEPVGISDLFAAAGVQFDDEAFVHHCWRPNDEVSVTRNGEPVADWMTMALNDGDDIVINVRIDPQQDQVYGGVDFCFRDPPPSAVEPLEPDPMPAPSNLVTGEQFSQPSLTFSEMPVSPGESSRFIARGLAYDAVVSATDIELGWNGSVADSDGLRIELVGANTNAEGGHVTTSGETKVVYEGIYPGIDGTYYGAGQQLEFDFIVHPGADPSHIGLRYGGLDDVHLDSNGNLVLESNNGELWQYPPVIYQEVDGVRQYVDGQYQLDADLTVRFDIGTYDSTLPLVIDPIMGGPDPGVLGPFAVTTTEYNRGLEVFTPTDFNVNDKVEVQAAVYYPTNMPNGSLPLVVLLHGRHATTYDPNNPHNAFAEWPPAPGHQVIPSYQGYAYAASLLASHGYIVVSISANGINAKDRFIQDGGALARAELIHHHLGLWADFNSGSVNEYEPFSTKFVGKVDLSRVGLMGHSRGGEGIMREVLHNRTLGSPFGIDAVFPVAPTNFSRGIIDNVPTGVFLSYADGDVSDLQGIHYFDDARYTQAGDLAPAYSYLLMGANHNFYNTVWTPGQFFEEDEAGAVDDWMEFQEFLAQFGPYQSDPWADVNVPGNHRLTYDQQQDTLSSYMAGFFRTFLGGEESFERMLRGDFLPPPSVPTDEIFASYHAPDNLATRLDVNRLSDTTNLTTNSLGGAVTTNNLVAFELCGLPSPEPACLPSENDFRQPHHTGLTQLHVAWDEAGASLSNDLPVGSRDVSQLSVLQFRAGVDFTDPRNPPKSPSDLEMSQDFTVVLHDGSGASASTLVGNWSTALYDPPGEVLLLPKLMLNTIRIPLSAFAGIDLSDVTRVTFQFDHQHGSGGLFLSDIAFASSGNFIADFRTVAVNSTADDIDAYSPPFALDADLGQSGAQVSLRSAIQEANTSVTTPGPWRIGLPAGNYVLTRTIGASDEEYGDLDISSHIQIYGDRADSSIIDANDIDRVFELVGKGQLRLDNITVRGGRASTGGGIRANTGTTLELFDSTVTDNVAISPSIGGGGLNISSGATASVVRSTISNNQAINHELGTGGQGGGIVSGGNLTIENSTISSNSTVSFRYGGGLYIGDGSADIRHTTIAANTAGAGGGIGIGSSGTVRLAHTIVADNTHQSVGGHDVFGTVISEGYNLIENTQGATINGDTTGNIVGVDPLLGPLTNNGGSTSTHGLMAGSPALNAGDPAISGAPTTDQRGEPRIFNGRIDIGAVERQKHLFVRYLADYPANSNGERNVVTDDVGGVLSVSVNGTNVLSTPLADDISLWIIGSPSRDVVTVQGTGTETSIYVAGGNDDVSVQDFTGTMSIDWGEGQVGFGGVILKTRQSSGNTYHLREDHLMLLNGAPAWSNIRDFEIGPDGTVFQLDTSGVLIKLPPGSVDWELVATNVTKFAVDGSGNSYALDTSNNLWQNSNVMLTDTKDFALDPDESLYQLGTLATGGTLQKRVSGVWQNVATNIIKFAVNIDGISYALDTTNGLWKDNVRSWLNIQDFALAPDGTFYQLEGSTLIKQDFVTKNWHLVTINVKKFAVGSDGISYALDTSNWLWKNTIRNWSHVKDFVLTPGNKQWQLATSEVLLRENDDGSWLTVAHDVKSLSVDINGLLQLTE